MRQATSFALRCHNWLSGTLAHGNCVQAATTVPAGAFDSQSGFLGCFYSWRAKDTLVISCGIQCSEGDIKMRQFSSSTPRQPRVKGLNEETVTPATNKPGRGRPPKRIPTEFKLAPPTQKQMALLARHGKRVPDSKREATAVISQLVSEQGPNRNEDAPPTSKQLAYLQSVGRPTPLTRKEAKLLINQVKADMAHEDKGPPTDRQKALLARLGQSAATRKDARMMIKKFKEENPRPPTEKQVIHLMRYQMEVPGTRDEAQRLINEIIARNPRPPSDIQVERLAAHKYVGPVPATLHEATRILEHLDGKQ